ncbi:MAG TPA: hypothetical protein PLS53_03605 [Thermoanaerobaculaceae bacterium]|nr:hypothetical protein [Thermoanaerobaculaceae bacterium]HPS77222.1 hypothetical protein [Thermoanaerobaculaceae bacterium]
MRKQELLVVGAVLGVAVALAVGAESPLSYARDVEPVFVKECVECHGGDNPKKGLDLSEGKGLKNLLDVKSTMVEMPILRAGDPPGSFLWLKLTHTATQGKGMPRTLFGARKLPKEQLDLIQQWIIQGAKP